MNLKKLSFREQVIREYAGHPLRTAANTVATGGAGVLFAHYGLGAEITGNVVFGAMLAPLFAILIAGALKQWE